MALGNVQQLLVDENIGQVKIHDPVTDEVTTLLIWSYFIQPDTPETRLLHAMFLALLRDALLHNLPVELLESNDGSTLVRYVKVQTPPG